MSDTTVDTGVVVFFIEYFKPVFQFVQRPEGLFAQACFQDVVKAFDVAVFLWRVGMCKHLFNVVFFQKCLDLEKHLNKKF